MCVVKGYDLGRGESGSVDREAGNIPSLVSMPPPDYADLLSPRKLYEDWKRTRELSIMWALRLAVIGMVVASVSLILWPFTEKVRFGIGTNPMPLPLLLLSFACIAMMTSIILWVVSSDRTAKLEEFSARFAIDEAAGDIRSADDLLGLIRLNRSQIQAYDLLARKHSASSHRASLAAMAVGLVMVGAGLAIVWLAPEAATKYSAAIIAATGTASGGFIAQTFIRVQRSAQDQMRYYFQQPLIHSYLLMAERLASQLPDELRGREYSGIISASLRQAVGVSVGDVSEGFGNGNELQENNCPQDQRIAT